MFATEKDGQTEYIDKGVQLGTHPTRKLEKHADSQKHKTAVSKYSHFTCSVNVYKKLNQQAQSQVERNREVIKKLHRCLYFLIRQKWAASENFEPFVRFVAELGVEDLERHIEADKRVTYLSSKSFLR